MLNDKLWALIAAVAGAITALSFRPFSDMRPIEILMALFVGASFSYFCGPWVVEMAFGGTSPDQRLIGGVYYLLATSSNILIPLLVKKLAGFLGTKEPGL